MSEFAENTADGDRDELTDELARAEAELADLDHQREAVRARIESTRERLSSRKSASESPGLSGATGQVTPSTPVEKIRLFRRLFRGRMDALVHNSCRDRGFAWALSPRALSS